MSKTASNLSLICHKLFTLLMLGSIRQTTTFLPCDCEAFARYCCRDSVCPSVCLTNACIVSPIMTNRKSPTSFPMSLRCTSYVAPNPQRGLKSDFFHFPYKKLGFSRRKSAIKFLCVKTFSSKVVRHSLAYLSVHKWSVGDVPFNLKYWAKVTHPLQKRRLPIDIRP